MIFEINNPFTEKRRCKIWWLSKKSLSLHRQNDYFDYAAECGEQARIETTPFKSHLRVAFIFHTFFGTTYETAQ